MPRNVNTAESDTALHACKKYLLIELDRSRTSQCILRNNTHGDHTAHLMICTVFACLVVLVFIFNPATCTRTPVSNTEEQTDQNTKSMSAAK